VVVVVFVIVLALFRVNVVRRVRCVDRSIAGDNIHAWYLYIVCGSPVMSATMFLFS
jgi:hypothetical protein